MSKRSETIRRVVSEAKQAKTTGSTHPDDVMTALHFGNHYAEGR